VTASTEPSPVWARTGTALRALSSMPLIQSGVALVTSSLISSALGLLFWILAARQYSSANVGISSAVITAMILLSDLSHLGLRTGLVRYVPTAGPDSQRLILRAYAVAVAVAGLGAVVFLAGLGWWVPELEVLRQSWFYAALFVAATMFWVVFQLEDSALLGLRLTPWVPVENGSFGLIKILLLFPLAGASGAAAQLGVFLAWSLPVFVVVTVVTVAMLRVLRRDLAGRRTPDRTSSRSWLRGGSLPMGEIMRFSLVDWAAGVGRSAVIGILPILVLSQAGASVSAYYLIAWTIAFSIYLLSANVADALLAESSYDRARIDRHTLHSGLLSMAISAPVVIVAIVVAPWVLRLYGQEYAEGAATTLRLLLLGSIPNVVTRTYVGRLKAERRMRAVFVFEALLSLGVLGLGWLLLSVMGIAGLGLAWLLVLIVAALYVLVVESLGWWAPRLDQTWSRRLVTAARLRHRLAQRLPRPALDRAVNERLAARYSTRPSWRRLHHSPHSQTVLVAGHEGRPPLRIDLAVTSWGAEVLSRRVAASRALGDMTGMPSCRALVPFPIEHHAVRGAEYLIESSLSGRPGDVAARSGPIDPLLDALRPSLADLHQATAGWFSFDQQNLDRWVSQPLRLVGEAVGAEPEALMPLGRFLCEGLEGQRVRSARIHGNLQLGNALFDTAGRLTGMVDWEWSSEGPAFLDWCSLALSALALHSDQDIGGAVRHALEEPEVFTAHHALAGRPLPEIDPRVLILFTWLHAVTPFVRSGPPAGMGRFWFIRNVESVLDRHRQTLALTP
jgi:O-antigen/teichoic acid export membrane protein